MLRHLRLHTWLPIFAVAAAACGGTSGGTGEPQRPSGNPPDAAANGDDDGGSTGPVMSITDYCTARAQLDSGWCAYIGMCCTAADKADTLFAPPGCEFGPTNPNDCIDLLTKQTGDGSVTYHGENAQACLAELAKWVPPPPSACSGVHLSDRVLTGHAQPAFVQIASCRQTQVGQLAGAAACQYDYQCTDGLRCRSYAGSSTDFRCQPSSTAGQPCSLQSDCSDGLQCIGKIGLATCDSLHGVGGSCLFTSDCQDGLICGNSVCITPPAIGASCDSSNGYTCAPLEGCDFSSTRCVSLKPDGAPCTVSGECTGRCDSTTKTCASICGGTW
jgi:hypothetical protein